jgi:hypothetical protein
MEGCQSRHEQLTNTVCGGILVYKWYIYMQNFEIHAVIAKEKMPRKG